MAWNRKYAGRRGQIFTMDMLVSLVVLTAVFGLLALEFEMIVNTKAELEGKKLELAANDVANVGVRRYLVLRDFYGEQGMLYPNKMNPGLANTSLRFQEMANRSFALFSALGVENAEIKYIYYDEALNATVPYPGYALVMGAGCGGFGSKVYARRVLLRDNYTWAGYERSGSVFNETSCGYLQVEAC